MSNNTIEILSQPEKVDMADDWYEYANLNHFWIQGRFNAFKSQLSGVASLSGSRLFEIGCGNGLIINQFEGAYKATVDGCDLNMLALQKIKDAKGKLYCLNIFEKPSVLQRKYDGVLLMDVVEHIDDDYAFLKASTEYLKDGGLVMINVPALNYFFSKYDEAAGHKRRYSKKMLLNLFEKNGIEPLVVSYWGLSLVPIVLLRKLILKIHSGEHVIKNGFEPPNGLINRLFKIMLSIENKVFRSPFLGTSVLAIGRLKNK